MPEKQTTLVTESSQKKMSIKFAAISWQYWFSMCFTIYTTTFLVSKGWSSSSVGIINSTNSAVGAVSTPIWGAISDRIGSVRKVIVILLLAVCILYPFIPFADVKIAGISVLFLLIPLSTFFKTPLNSLIDNWTVRTCNKYSLKFGAIRSFGSISFGIVGIALGFVVPVINAKSESGNLGTILTFPAYTVFSVLLLLLIFSTKDESQGFGSKQSKQSFKDMHFEQLTKNYYYMSYLVYAMIIQLPLSCVFSLFSYLLQDIGADVNYIGYVQGLKAFIEIPMLLLLDKVRNKCPLYYLLMASGVLYMLEAFFYSKATNFTQILFICFLQGLAGGLHIAAGSNYVATLAPSNLKATAQTLNGSMVSLAGIIGNAAGGFLVEAIGIRAFYMTTAVILFVAIVLYALSFVFGEKVLKIPRPQIVKHG